MRTKQQSMNTLHQLSKDFSSGKISEADFIKFSKAEQNKMKPKGINNLIQAKSNPTPSVSSNNNSWRPSLFGVKYSGPSGRSNTMSGGMGSLSVNNENIPILGAVGASLRETQANAHEPMELVDFHKSKNPDHKYYTFGGLAGMMDRFNQQAIKTLPSLANAGKYYNSYLDKKDQYHSANHIIDTKNNLANQLQSKDIATRKRAEEKGISSLTKRLKFNPFQVGKETANTSGKIQTTQQSGGSLFQNWLKNKPKYPTRRDLMKGRHEEVAANELKRKQIDMLRNWRPTSSNLKVQEKIV